MSEVRFASYSSRVRPGELVGKFAHFLAEVTAEVIGVLIIEGPAWIRSWLLRRESIRRVLVEVSDE